MIRITRSVLVLAFGCFVMASAAPAVSAQSDQDTAKAAKPDRAEKRKKLLAALKTAQTVQEARSLENRIWAFWTHGPDDEANQQISEIFAARRARDLDKALRIANALTERLPDYAEGWNQKATVLFMQGRWDRSLDAVERALELEPKHFGALAGKGVILMRQGRVELAQVALRRAVAINPFLRERRLLIKDPGQPL